MASLKELREELQEYQNEAVKAGALIESIEAGWEKEHGLKGSSAVGKKIAELKKKGEKLKSNYEALKEEVEEALEELEK